MSLKQHEFVKPIIESDCPYQPPYISTDGGESIVIGGAQTP